MASEAACCALATTNSVTLNPRRAAARAISFFCSGVTRASRRSSFRERRSKPLSVVMTFAGLFEGWTITVVPTIKNTTADYYLKMLNAHVSPAFGERGIQAIGRYEVETFLAERAKMFCRN